LKKNNLNNFIPYILVYIIIFVVHQLAARKVMGVDQLDAGKKYVGKKYPT